MSKTGDQFAYRCLPLVIANSHGWEVLLDEPFSATWNGNHHPSDLQISSLGEQPARLPTSHFGNGILTFNVGYLVRTEPKYNLWVNGPVNHPKDGIVPLSGVIETDWAPYTFTMNWIFTRPGSVTFQKDEPICHFFPIQRGLVTEIEPEIRDLDEDPVNLQVQEWRDSRKQFLEAFHKGEEAAVQSGGWQKHYFRGLAPDGTKITEDHQSRLLVKPFVDCRSGEQITAETPAPASPRTAED
jgi:uncharacterized protein DUF6065